jgi:catalase
MANTVKESIKTRKIAILAADGVDETELSSMTQALSAVGAQPQIVAPRLGSLKSAQGGEVSIDFSFLTAGSVLFDAVYVPGGAKSIETLQGEAKAVHFINEAYNHCKTIAATGAGIELLRASYLGADETSKLNGVGDQMVAEEGVIISREAQNGLIAAEFIHAIAQHRHWSREMREQVPA